MKFGVRSPSSSSRSHVYFVYVLELAISTTPNIYMLDAGWFATPTHTEPCNQLGGYYNVIDMGNETEKDRLKQSTSSSSSSSLSCSE